MMFLSVEDFFNKTQSIKLLSRDEQAHLAARMRNNDPEARQMLIEAYLPVVAAHIKRAPKALCTLHTLYTCIDSLEKGVDSFNFLQEGESFTHHLSWRMRQCITRCLAERR
ncbi:MAG: hypothetical protein E7646_04645 [Ruminococcaceae bacterium]|nr:hypothetical protein [Oscillospiraceae bacterium]